MVNKTEENMEKLAKEVAENMPLDDLISFAREIHFMHYEESDEEFQEDWEMYME